MIQTLAQQIEADNGKVVTQPVMIKHGYCFTELDCEKEGLKFKPTHLRIYTLVKSYSVFGYLTLYPTGERFEPLKAGK